MHTKLNVLIVYCSICYHSIIGQYHTGINCYTFNCSATTGIVVWIVNGSLLSELYTSDITASQVGQRSFLHIPATEKYNNTNVTCAVASLLEDDLYSDPVVLKVQG